MDLCDSRHTGRKEDAKLPVNPHCIKQCPIDLFIFVFIFIFIAKPSQAIAIQGPETQDSFDSRAEKSHPTMDIRREERKSCGQTVATRVGARVHSGVGPRVDPGSRTTSPDAEILLRPCIGIGPRVLWNLRGPSALNVHV